MVTTPAVTPSWAVAYEVVPDEQAAGARLRRFRRTMTREAFEFGPRVLIPHLPELREHPELQVDGPSKIDEAVAAVKETLRAGVVETWRRLRAVELVVAEVQGEFDGEDPLLPEARQVVDACRTDLAALRKDTERLAGRSRWRSRARRTWRGCAWPWSARADGAEMQFGLVSGGVSNGTLVPRGFGVQMAKSVPGTSGRPRRATAACSAAGTRRGVRTARRRCGGTATRILER